LNLLSGCLVLENPTPRRDGGASDPDSGFEADGGLVGPAPCEVDPTVGGDECSGDQLCVAGRCEDALPGRYEIAIFGATLFERSFEPWDDDGTAPDVRVELWVDGHLEARSEVGVDRTAVSFDPPIAREVTLGLASTIRIDVLENDASWGDLAFRCEVEPVHAAVLRNGQLGCSSSIGSLLATIDRR
jgi:hypothetical protein